MTIQVFKTTVLQTNGVDLSKYIQKVSVENHEDNTCNSDSSGSTTPSLEP